MLPCKIVIPSYKRCEIITRKTLALLHKYGVDWTSVYVFVVQEEECSYKSALTSFIGINIVTGPEGLMHMRNFITTYFDEGQQLLSFDDDIDDLYVLNHGCLAPMTAVMFIEWITSAFQELGRHKAGLFGIYPVRNAYFMSPSMSTDLKFCVGAVWGAINRKSILIGTEEKEDFDRTLQYYLQDKCVLRFNYITLKTAYYRTKGGMQSRDLDRRASSIIACQYLLNKYPAYTRLYTGKKSGIWEVRLRSNNGSTGATQTCPAGSECH